MSIKGPIRDYKLYNTYIWLLRYQLQTTNYTIHTYEYKVPITDYKLYNAYMWVLSYQLQNTNYTIHTYE
jgi:hypothetical protein